MPIKMSGIILSLSFFCLLHSSCRFVRTVSIARDARKQSDEPHPDDVMKVPFVYKNGWIHLRLKVLQGNTSLDGFFLFDTGAFTNLFDSCGSLLVITPDAMEMPVKGALGKTYVKMKVAEDVILELDQLKVRKPKVLVNKRPPGFPLDCVGMIGADFFRNCILQIDFKDSFLRIIPENQFKPTYPAIQFQTVANYNPVLSKLELGGLLPDNYLFDLGSKQSIFIQKDDERELRKTLRDSVLSYALSSSGAPKDASEQSIHSNYYVRYGNSFNLGACPEFEIGGIVNPENSFRKSNLGLGFSRSVFSSVTLDMRRHLFYYQIISERPEADRLSRDIYFNDSNSTFFTGFVLTTSSWYEQGVRPRQKVLRINGESPSRYMEASKYGRNVPVVSITILTGEGPKELSLKSH